MGEEMAKIRIYELAKIFNMTNKELLGKLDELGIEDIKSHMSSLDDDVVEKVKAIFFSARPEKIEEVRVKPTVIRRRKKIVSEELVQEEINVADPAPLEGIGEEKTDVAKTPPGPPSIPSPPEPEKPQEASEKKDVAADVREETPKKATKAPGKKGRKRVGKGSSAKIIKPAPPEEAEAPLSPDEELDDAPAAKTEAKTDVAADAKAAAKPDVKTAAKADVKPDVTADVEKTVAKADIKAGDTPDGAPEDRSSDVMTDKDSPSDAPPKAKADQKSDEKKETKKEDKKKPRKKSATDVVKPTAKKKRKKGDAPAKIIKLPTSPPETSRSKDETGKETTSYRRFPRKQTQVRDQSHNLGPKKTVAAPKADDASAGKKDKKKVSKVSEDKKFLKKKISFKKKSVIEDLKVYSGKRRSRKPRGGRRGRAVRGEKTEITTPKAIKRRLKIDETIILSDLAKRMGVKANEMIGALMKMGVMVTMNQSLDFETAVIVAAEFSYELEKASFVEENFIEIEETNPEKLIPRLPVVSIMGHVDHGKTSLLDVIRKSRITETETGGITQHIGAYHISTKSGQIVFLDTPGHEAFTAMRSRGAKITDFVVLVVAADDGVMPQTVEAINHAKAANVGIIVAVNKIDKPGANVERVQRQLAEAGLVPEEWGGDTVFVKVSAKENIGIGDLLEMIILQAEIMELKANPDKKALGRVVEAKIDSGRGPVATVLIQDGTLKTGDSVVCGAHYGKVRAMIDDRGVHIDLAGPSIPIEILGLSGVPNAGDDLVAVATEKDAKQISLHREMKQRSTELGKMGRVTLEKLFEKMEEGDVKDLNLILKADVQGSIEAIQDSLRKLSEENKEVKIQIVHSATGGITESDVSLATVSNSIIIGFNVRPSGKVAAMAAEDSVDVRYYNIIYNLIKDINNAILGMMDSTFEDRTLGRATVREVFHVPKLGSIAGCYVTEGKIQRGGLVRLLRDGIVLYEGKISSLKRFKDDAKEVQNGYECGLGIENYNDLKVDDELECYYVEEIRPQLK